MELRTIKTFHLIAKTGSFQKAAEILQYSQPTISMRIKQLEDELGVALFYRGKTLKLTQPGRLFYERSKELLNQYDELDQTIAHLKLGDTGLINIGISDPTASLIFPKVLKHYLQHHPNMVVNVRIEDANTCSQDLIHGAIDFAICGEPQLILDNYFEPFYYDSLNLLVANDNPLARRASVRIEELESETFIFTPENCPIRIQIEQALKHTIGVNYKKMEVTTSLAHKYYVRENIGVSVFTQTAHQENFPGTTTIPIENLTINPPIGLLTPVGKVHYDPLVLELIQDIVDQFQYGTQHLYYPKVLRKN